MKRLENFIEKIIFASRWFQAPLYLGLIVTGLLYTYKFFEELIHLCMDITVTTEAKLMLSVLTLIDVTMVANLLIMVIIGGYATFVSKLDIDHQEDKPEWLKMVGAGTLKVKLAVSLIGISSIHLLQSFINIAHRDLEQVKWQLIIHGVFLISAIVLAYTDKLLHETGH